MNLNWHRPRDCRGRFCREGEEGSGPARRAGKPGKAWPKDKEAVFFRELGMASDLGRALKAAKLAAFASEVPERLRTDPKFLAKWNAALAAGLALLDLELLGRGRLSDQRPEPGTAAEKRLRELPNSVALQLLKHHHARMKGQPGAAVAARPERRLDARELRKRLEAKLADFNRRMGGEG